MGYGRRRGNSQTRILIVGCQANKRATDKGKEKERVRNYRGTERTQKREGDVDRKKREKEKKLHAIWARQKYRQMKLLQFFEDLAGFWCGMSRTAITAPTSVHTAIADPVLLQQQIQVLL